VLQQRALADGAARTAAGHESPCAERPTLVRHPRVIEAARRPGACIQAAALPTFISPFSWRIVRQYPHGYEISQRSVLGPNDDLPAAWIPSEASPWTARARATTTAASSSTSPASPRRSSCSTTRRRGRAPRRRAVHREARWALDLEPRGRSPFTATIALDAEGGPAANASGD
jgi:hypothetical protein